MERVWNAVVSAVFPLRCGLCGLIAESGVCSSCLDSFEPLKERVSHHAPLDPVQISMSLYRYQGRVAQAVQRLKYERVTSLADPLALLLAQGYSTLDVPRFDLIVPVPIHWRRLCWRGFNQAELLARQVEDFYAKAQRMQRGVHKVNAETSRNSALLRIKATRPQVGLSATERLTNLIGAFRADESVKGKTVLMVDDVFTSGSTARACGAALRAAGASYVGILTLARGDDVHAA